MKHFLASLVVLLLLTSTAHADLEARGTISTRPVMEIPRGHWSYELLEAIFSEQSLKKYDYYSQYLVKENRTLWRFEAAVAIARITEPNKSMVDDHRAKGFSVWDATPKSLELVDAMAALQIEFAPELERLSQRM